RRALRSLRPLRSLGTLRAWRPGGSPRTIGPFWARRPWWPCRPRLTLRSLRTRRPGRPGRTGYAAAVVEVHDAVTVDVLGVRGFTVAVEVPASQPVYAAGAGRADGSGGSYRPHSARLALGPRLTRSSGKSYRPSLAHRALRPHRTLRTYRPLRPFRSRRSDE